MLGRVAVILPITLAVAASVGGWWLLGGVTLAACLAYCAGRAGAVGAPDSPSRGAVRLRTALRTASNVAVLAVSAAMAGVYVVPGLGPLGPVLFVLLVVTARVAGVTIHPTLLRWGTGALLVAGLAFAAVCFAVEPAPSAGGLAGDGLAGMLFTAAVAFPVFSGGGTVLRSWRLVLATALGLLVATAALYQSGPVRLGLSPTSLRDVLAAADAQLLLPVLAIVIGLAAPRVALEVLEAEPAPDVRGRAGTAVPAGAAAAVLAVALGPASALVLAAVLSLAEVLASAVPRHTLSGRVTAVLTVLLLAGLPLPLLV